MGKPSQPTASDVRWMRRALALARKAAGRTAPNPIVGCVIVSPRGKVLAEGFHARAGEPHAEAVALAQLGGVAKGATMIVSLEPCNHRGARRTAPCTPAVLASGVKRVVYGAPDPFPGHGGGATVLAAAGVTVVGPVLEEECVRANAPFFTWARAQRAHVTLKAAMTLDGRIATASGESRWITGEVARAHAHGLRDVVDAIVVGAGTVTADDPALTTRGIRGGRDAVRVVVDGRLSTAPTAQVYAAAAPGRETIVATADDAPADRVAALEARGVRVWRIGAGPGLVDLAALSARLGEAGLLAVLVEGGAVTHAGFLAAGVVDRLLLYVAPRAIGGRGAPAWLGGPDVGALAQAHGFTFSAPPKRLGDDLLLTLEHAR